MTMLKSHIYYSIYPHVCADLQDFMCICMDDFKAKKTCQLITLTSFFLVGVLFQTKEKLTQFPYEL